LSLSAAQAGQLERAAHELRRITPGRPHLTPVFELRRQLADCLVRVLGQDRDAISVADRCRNLAMRQGAAGWEARRSAGWRGVEKRSRRLRKNAAGRGSSSTKKTGAETTGSGTDSSTSKPSLITNQGLIITCWRAV
jgi:hypothetical protein